MTRRNLLATAALVTLLAASGAVLVWIGSPEVLRLAGRSAEEAQTIELAGSARRSLAPPFPSRLAFELQVPEAASLELATALVMERDVSRARVEYRVSVESDGARTELLRQLIDVTEANVWHHHRVDLGAWSGRSVRLTLETRADPPRETTLWANRIRTVWGDPVIRRRPWAPQVRAAADELDGVMEWLRSEASRAGLVLDERKLLSRLSVDLLLAGLLSLAWAAVLGRLPRERDGGGDLRAILPLLTLAVTLVIAVVHLSVPLSLGLLGALSLVRFRTPIAGGGDLLTILMGVALGLTLGSGNRLLALTLVTVVTPILWALARGRKERVERRILLTASGSGGAEQLRALLSELPAASSVRELGFRDSTIVFDALLTLGSRDAAGLMGRLRQRLPEFRLSCRIADRGSG